jgi:hypothetical protein
LPNLNEEGTKDPIERFGGEERDMADNTEKDPRDWVSGDDPMTGAQASYLKTLCEQAHMPEPGKDLTKAEASELIDKVREKAGLKERD